ncbi:MAG: hypothetical protein ACP5E5_05155 [Acidobacteriaceae bacterium]
MQQILSHTLRLGLAVSWLSLAVAGSGAAAQTSPQTLPPIQPTASAAQPVPASAPATASPPLRAQILYANGLLQVRADNSSLNQILRSISQKTGLQITGGVQEQRVFGNYGPASISTVLSTLLDGAGVNILILTGQPPQLILTQTNGQPDPPSPNAPIYAIYDQAPPVPPPAAQGANSPSSGSLSGSGATKPAIPSVVSHAVPANAPIATPSAQPRPAAMGKAAAPAKVLTPEMVMQELLKMQQQQTAQQKEKLKALNQQVQQEQLQATKASAAAGTPANPPSQPTGNTTPQP